MRFVLRFDRLLHSHVAEVGVRADGGNVNAFERSASRQNNVGKACRSRPHRVAHDRRFGTLPSLDQAIGVFLLGKGVAARPEDQTDVRISDLLAVVVNRLAGVEEAVGKASQRNGRQRFADPRQTFAAALRVGGNAAQCGSHRSGRTAVGVVIAKAEATAGLADVAAHSSKHHHHPMNLFAVLSTLDTPATHQHGALFAHQVSQALDSVSLYVANLFCPFGGLRHAIGLAEHIGDELVVTHGVLADEFAIHLTGSLEFIRHTEHHGNVGTGLRSDPFTVLAEVFGCVGFGKDHGRIFGKRPPGNANVRQTALFFQNRHGNSGTDLSKVTSLSRLIEVQHARRIERGRRSCTDHGQKGCGCHQLFDHLSSLLFIDCLSIPPLLRTTRNVLLRSSASRVESRSQNIRVISR